MPPLDYPNTPGVGDIYKLPDGAEMFWDGEKWTTLIVAYLPLTGGTMLGSIYLPPWYPTLPYEATHKQYVDESIAAQTLYQGLWQVEANLPDLTPSVILPQNGYSWLAQTVDQNIPELAPAGLPGIGGTFINAGDSIRWNGNLSIYERARGASMGSVEAALTFVNIDGDRMTGRLILSQEPTLTDTHEAAPKWYVDSIGNVIRTEADLRYVNVGGDVMRGLLTLASDPTVDLHSATKRYVDQSIAAIAMFQGIWFVSANNPDLDPNVVFPEHTWSWIAQTVDPNIPEVVTATLPGLTGLTIAAGDHVVWNANVNEYVHVRGASLNTQEAFAVFINAAGDTMSGVLNLAADPINPMEAANKRYVDTHLTPNEADALYVNIVGDQMTGYLSLHALPIDSMHAATKGYVDTQVGAGITGVTAGQGLTGGGTSGDITLSVVQATQTVFGGGMVAANPDIAGGTDDTRFVTSLGLRSQLGADGTALYTNSKTVIPAINELISNIAQLAGVLVFAGAYNATLDQGIFNGNGGIPEGQGVPLPVASSLNQGAYLIITTGGPGGGINEPVEAMEVQDWLISDGTQWVLIKFGPATIAYLPLTGGTMQGFISLHADPTGAMHAVTKNYVDNNYVLLAGDVMTGWLTLNADPTALLHAATKQYVDNSIVGFGSITGVTAGAGLTGGGTTGDITLALMQATQTVFGGGLVATDLDIAGGALDTSFVSPRGLRSQLGADGSTLVTLSKTVVPAINEIVGNLAALAGLLVFAGAYNATTQTGAYNGNGGIAQGTGPLPAASAANSGAYLLVTMPGAGGGANEPVGPMEVQDWLVSDGVIWNLVKFGPTAIAFLPLAGGSMSGFINLHADPSIPLHAATKQYVDAAISGFGSITSITAGPGLSGGGTSGDVTLSLVQATQTVFGGARIATSGEISSGTADTFMVTPAGLRDQLGADASILVTTAKTVVPAINELISTLAALAGTLVFAGAYDAAANLGTFNGNGGIAQGQNVALPAPSAANYGAYLLVIMPGAGGGPNEPAAAMEVYDWLVSDGVTWILVKFGPVSIAFLPLSGGTMQGFITLHSDPVNNMHAATKAYVDNSTLSQAEADALFLTPLEADAAYVNVTGDVMTGFLTLNAPPTANLHAATKAYVDTATGSVGTITSITAGPGLSGGGSVGAVTLSLVQATQALIGGAEIATSGEISSGTADTFIVTPLGLRGQLGADAQTLVTTNKTVIPAINELISAIAAAVGVLVFAGAYDAQSGLGIFNGNGGIAQGQDVPLPAASAANYGSYLLVIMPGPGGGPNEPAGTMEAHDWLISDGAVWILVKFGPVSVAFLPLIGGTMQGFITLHSDPTANMHAATKAYVDNNTLSQGEADALFLTPAEADLAYVNVSGDTMTGFLTLNAPPTANLHAATKQYVDSRAVVQATQTLLGGGEIATAAEIATGAADTFIVSPLGLRSQLGADAQTLVTSNKTVVPAINELISAITQLVGIVVFGGTYDAATNVATFNGQGGIVAGTGPLPVPSVANGGTFLIVNVGGAGGGPNEPVDTMSPQDWLISDSTEWILIKFGSQAAWLPLSGGTMTGFITLHAPPTANLHAATKAYVDSTTLSQAEADTRYVNVAGDTMTGTLAINTGTLNLGPAATPTTAGFVAASATMRYNAGGVIGHYWFQDAAAATAWAWLNGGGLVVGSGYYHGIGSLGALTGGGPFTYLDQDQTVFELGGGTTPAFRWKNFAATTLLTLESNGYLTLIVDPTLPLHAATKQYVDSRPAGGMDQATADARYVNVTGDTMTGDLIVTTNVSVRGRYLYLDLGSGNVSAVGGPFLYADPNYMVFKTGSVNEGWLWQDYNGVQQAYLSVVSGFGITKDVYVGGAANVTGALTAGSVNTGGEIIGGIIRCRGTGIAYEGVGEANNLIAFVWNPDATLHAMVDGVSVGMISTNIDALYVNTAGDTMTGNLSLPNLVIQAGTAAVPTGAAITIGARDASAQWTYYATGDTLRWYTGLADRMWVTNQGNLTVSNAFQAALITSLGGCNSASVGTGYIGCSGNIDTLHLVATGNISATAGTMTSRYINVTDALGIKYGVSNNWHAFSWDGNLHFWIDGIYQNWIPTGSTIAGYLPLAGGTLNNGGSDPLQILAPVGAYARIRYHVTNMRIWSLGTSLDGNFMLADETGSAVRTIFGVDGTLTNYGNISTTGTIYGGGLVSYWDATVTATLFAPYVNCSNTVSTWNLNATGTVTAVQVTSSGNMNATGQITGGYIYSYGNIDSAGTVNAVQITSSGNINAASIIHANGYVSTNAYYYIAGTLFAAYANSQTSLYCGSVGMQYFYLSGTTYYDNNQHSVRTNGGSVAYCLFNGSGSYNQTAIWYLLSSADYKENIQPYERGLDALLALQPVQYNYRAGATPFTDESNSGVLRYGFVAEEVEPFIPEMVGTTSLEVVEGGEQREFITLGPGHLVYVLTNAVKELAAMNEALSARIAALEGTIQ